MKGYVLPGGVVALCAVLCDVVPCGGTQSFDVWSMLLVLFVCMMRPSNKQANSRIVCRVVGERRKKEQQQRVQPQKRS